MKAPEFIRWDTARLGALGETAMRAWFEREGYQTARYVYPPGTAFPDHTHAVDKIDAVLSGRFRITLAGDAVVLEAGLT